MSTPTRPLHAVPAPVDTREDDILRARRVRKLRVTGPSDLGRASLPDLLLHALSDGHEDPLAGMRATLRDELAALAALANNVTTPKALDGISVPEHLGRPLEAAVRKLDVLDELERRLTQGRVARRAQARQNGGSR